MLELLQHRSEFWPTAAASVATIKTVYSWPALVRRVDDRP